MNDEPRLRGLVDLCKSDLDAIEVWLFGSRARGDEHPGSDWDVLAVIPDCAPRDCDSVKNVWKVKRASGLPVDLLTVRAGEFAESITTLNTISHAVASEGVRLDAEPLAAEVKRRAELTPDQWEHVASPADFTSDARAFLDDLG
ncbi:hypothetical protein BMI91_19520 [Thioclava sediminum]|uniref:Polymerase nucleotidyl transferase domain-containing protein n=1 Tax=Thioclava sediminum TaxID=1915319 RepID=A0ABX3MSE8_9RHOB|nr:nucleotidyltransferase domain-containing protein [Thioclava sediminum]OOY22473.1 hypothetical protein BMI91_19520 [Thioclava sediminum]